MFTKPISSDRFWSAAFLSAAFFSCFRVRLRALQLSQTRHRVPGTIKLQQSSSLHVDEDLERFGAGYIDDYQDETMAARKTDLIIVGTLLRCSFFASFDVLFERGWPRPSFSGLALFAFYLPLFPGFLLLWFCITFRLDDWARRNDDGAVR